MFFNTKAQTEKYSQSINLKNITKKNYLMERSNHRQIRWDIKGAFSCKYLELMYLYKLVNRGMHYWLS